MHIIINVLLVTSLWLEDVVDYDCSVTCAVRYLHLILYFFCETFTSVLSVSDLDGGSIM